MFAFLAFGGCLLVMLFVSALLISAVVGVATGGCGRWWRSDHRRVWTEPRRPTGRDEPLRSQPRADDSESMEDRYVRGDLTLEEYEAHLGRKLGEQPPGAGPTERSF